ncbi:phenylacetate--CoA ligase PaaK [Xenorhabdus bovienii]|uniref:phenylacetate--CoA ligase PaaK n=1 Tax=Xenorhabdus bovienii TaxID=40576 RepID=UPI0023B27022|nr:phenylacetate--CoA ligase PaaK [Xenorhabdus bovienii]MDE9462241.1 phenylacetate--CoA ligase [Xenorhabdus bovienii]MDE9470197.1 phenylacetate--CoA ligase [Xenorhabdus bovienii]
MSNNVQHLDSIEFASRDEIQAHQFEQIKWTLHHAYNNVPMYRRKFDTAGIHPSDFKQLEDITKFPYTTKQDLRDHYPFDTFAVPMEQIVRIHASSGTTGHPTVVGYTQRDIDHWANLVARCLRFAGASAKDKVHVAYGYGLFTGGLGAHYGAERLGATVIPMSGGQTEKQAQLILDFKPDVIMMTPSYCLTLLDALEQRMDGDASKCSLRVGIFGAEPWTEALRREIETRMGIKALDIYGLSEVMGPGIAMESVEHANGSTIWEDHFYPEVIDPDNLNVLPDGESGELVFTTLTKEAMPVIRYRTRDLTRLLPGTARHMRRMDRITGRSDDMLIIRGINVFPSQVEEQIIRFKELSPHYQLEVNRTGNYDCLSVKVELKEPERLDAQQRCDICHQLRHHIKSMIGLNTEVSIVNCGDIPRSEGKAVRVIDHRQHE